MTETSKRISVRVDAPPAGGKPHPGPPRAPTPATLPSLQAPDRMLAQWLADNQCSQRGLAERSGMSRKLVNMLCRGQRRVTVPTAFRLEKATGITAERWMVSTVLAEVEE